MRSSWLSLLLLVGCASAASRSADPPQPVPPGAPWLEDATVWPRLRDALAGSWTSADGGWRLEAHAIARDSALLQTWTSPGGVTANLFHPDGSALVLVHYCAQGNQATLRMREADARSVVFAQERVTNLAEGGSALCRLVIEVETDAVRLRETYCDAEGSPEAPQDIVLHRVSPGPG